MKILGKLLCTAVFITGGLTTNAQQTAIYDLPDAEFRDAQELFNKEKYGAAQQKFLKVIKMNAGKPSELNAQSAYYTAMCALELFNDDASYRVVNYVRTHPEHTRVYLAWYQLARYHFRFKRYEEALAAFEKVDQYKLNDEEKNEYQFKSGYCYFMKDDLEAAKKAFFTLKETDSKYAAGATYYFAHISYQEKNYETALKSFRKITSDEVYGKFTPYYITQIYYIQQKYDELLKVAPPLLDSASTRRAPEIARMIGSAYFKTQRFADALLYLHMYIDKSSVPPTRDDFYELAYCYYRTSDPDNAIIWFGKVNTSPEDSLSQLTLYQLADCKLQTGDYLPAINYFHMAYQLGIDPLVSEDALFNYAKLAYEKGYNPYNEAIKSFNLYIAEFPKSSHIDEAYEYLSGMYLSTRNYKDALVSLESIKNRDVKLNRAYQKVCYFRGIEYFNDADYSQAIAHFKKSSKVPVDVSIAAQSIYWTGEAFYRMEQWDSSLWNFQKFQQMPGAFGSTEYNLANYQSGYCWFKKMNYASALTAFRKFTGAASKENPAVINDGYLRAADCFFMTKDYSAAVENYNKSIAMKLTDNDYALYQKALAYGPMGKFESKVAALDELIAQYPSSSYYDDALFEAGNTWQNMTNQQKALPYYDKVIANCPQSAYVSKALLKKGLIYYNTDQDEKALVTLKQVVTDYRGTEDSKEALMSLKNVFVSMDKVPDLFEYVKSLGENLSDDVQDSITWTAVENKFMNNDCKGAVRGFTDYIERFPDGQFAMDAYFYRSECLYSDQDKDAALAGYTYVIGKPASKYLETSLAKAAEITFTQKNFNDAILHYKRLEDVAQYKNNILAARIGIMRSQALLMHQEDAIEAAQHLLTTEKLSEDLQAEAHMVIGRCALSMDSISTAVAEFSQVYRLSKGELGAEAKWSLGYIQYQLGNYDESEKIAFDLVNQVPSYDYWVAKAFILLADNYLKKGNNRQAKYTLQSIIDNYEGADLVKLAQDKYNLILEAEKQEELLKQQQLQQVPENPVDGTTPEETSPEKF